MSIDAPPEATTEPHHRVRRPAVGSVLLAAVAYVPLLLTAPGEVGADTKTYLYLDPGRLLGRAVSMWDTNIGLGTVTHQNIGYLWPMGPWYWFWDTLGVPDWVAQRLWLGTLILAAGLGVRFMLRELRWVGPGLTVASFAYALSPYLLHYGARISVILLPFAGLPWLIGLASRSVHRGGWRWPSAFALVTLTVGGVNATSLILVMAGPVLWMAWAVFVNREATLSRTLGAGLRITALTLATSTWWIAGLAIQGAYGIPILRYTETYHTVANAALSTELLRGLGYWFFYGRDALGAWIAPAERMVESVPALALSFAVPGLAVASGFLTRFRNKGYFVLLLATGLVLGVGAHPWDAPTPAGDLFQAWTRTDSGLAFRSTPRAVPLIALGLAVLLAGGLSAVVARRPSWRLALSGALLLLICLNQWALFGGEMVDRNLERDEELPRYWLDAAAAMEADPPPGTDPHETRVYEMPGTDFASYRWGNTVDPITPGLMDRPYVARELIPYGTPPSADLLNAWDLPLQEGTFDPSTITPVAQLMGVGTIAHRGDLSYERFRTPRPDAVYRELLGAPGLGEPRDFGVGVPNRPGPELLLDDELQFALPADREPAPAVSLFDLEDPRPIARTVSGTSPTLLAGDGAGIVAWAGTGALDPDRPILYSGSWAGEPEALEAQIAVPGSQLVVTDTNRRQARRWGSVRENDGYTERAGEVALEVDPADNRLAKFPGAGDDAFTVTEQVGGATVAASAYGNPVSYTPADRAANAMDGDPDSAWRVGAFDEPRGEYLRIRADAPVTADHLTLLQSSRGGNRWITEVELSFDGGEPEVFPLTEESFAAPGGQRLDFGERTFQVVRITITEANVGVLDRYVGYSDVGIAEVGIPGVGPVREIVRPPTDLLAAAGDDAIDHPLNYVFTRRAADPVEVVVDDEEPNLVRAVEGPQARAFSVFGSARASTDLDDAAFARLLGVPGPDGGGVAVRSEQALGGDARSRAVFAADGDPATGWQTPVNGAVGASIELEAAEPFEFDGFELVLRTDGAHSVPTVLSVSVDGGPAERVEVPAVDPGEQGSDDTPARVTMDPRSASTIAVTIEEVDEVRSTDWFSGDPTVLPVGIVELGLGVEADVPEPATALDAGCRDDLVSVDGEAVPVRVAGTVGDVLHGDLLDLAGCAAVDLPAGRSLLRTAAADDAPFTVDRLVLASGPGGVPGPNTMVEGPAPVDPAPETESTHPGRLEWRYEVRDATEPYWLVLGQSHSPGFRATTDDGTDLGEPVVVNGYANGWLVDPDEVGPDVGITVTWYPQGLVWLGLALSAVGVLLCLGLLLWPVRRWAGRPSEEVPPPTHPEAVAPFSSAGAPIATVPALMASLGAGALTWLFAGWAVGVAIAVLTMLSLVVPRGEWILRIAGLGLLGASFGFVVLKQWRNGYVVDFNWMNQFETTHAWALAAIALLAVDVAVDRLRRT